MSWGTEYFVLAKTEKNAILLVTKKLPLKLLDVYGCYQRITRLRNIIIYTSGYGNKLFYTIVKALTYADQVALNFVDCVQVL